MVKRSVPRPRDSYQVAEIQDWRWSYTMGVQQPSPHDSRGVFEFAHLAIDGPLIRTSIKRAKTLRLRLLPDRDMNERKWPDHEPQGVGGLSLSNGVLETPIGFPDDRLGPLLTALAAKHFRFVVLATRPLEHRGEFAVRSWRLSSTYDATDLPDDP